MATVKLVTDDSIDTKFPNYLVCGDCGDKYPAHREVSDADEYEAGMVDCDEHGHNYCSDCGDMLPKPRFAQAASK